MVGSMEIPALIFSTAPPVLAIVLARSPLLRPTYLASQSKLIVQDLDLPACFDASNIELVEGAVQRFAIGVTAVNAVTATIVSTILSSLAIFHSVPGVFWYFYVFAFGFLVLLLLCIGSLLVNGVAHNASVRVRRLWRRKDGLTRANMTYSELMNLLVIGLNVLLIVLAMIVYVDSNYHSYKFFFDPF